MAIVADADPALGAGIQRRLHVSAELVQGFHLPVGKPVDSVQFHHRQAASLPQVWPRVDLPEPVGPRMEMCRPIQGLSCIAGGVYPTSPDHTRAHARLMRYLKCRMLAAYHRVSSWTPAGCFCSAQAFPSTA